MCGEIDEQAMIGQELLDRARALGRRIGLGEGASGAAGDAPRGLAEDAGRAAYMERVFSETYARCLADLATAEEDEAVDALAAQAIALARLAGFLAGQLPPEADLYRAVIEAATAGHAEAKDAAEAMSDHHHHHHHNHDHDHHHH